TEWLLFSLCATRIQLIPSLVHPASSQRLYRIKLILSRVDPVSSQRAVMQIQMILRQLK
ncbi:hypothetical protein ABG768_016023, partial [Culter alburnus]